MFRYPQTSVTIILALAVTCPVKASTRVWEGPVLAQVIRVVDGDTVEVQALPWPDHRIDTLVRLRGIDAPELTSRCRSFRALALLARKELQSVVRAQETVTLRSISGDKYFGRVVADLYLADGRRPASILLEAGLAEPYDGKTKPGKSCPD